MPMTPLSSLATAAQERKARLAQLKNVKRKQDEAAAGTTDSSARTPTAPSIPHPQIPSQRSTGPDDGDDAYQNDTGNASRESDEKDVTHFLSGRNYDAVNRAPKLGFEEAPIAEGQETLERRAERLLEETELLSKKIIPQTDIESTQKNRAAGGGAAGTVGDGGAKGKDGSDAGATIDLFSLRPKKPNWDLRRELDRRLEVLNVQTDNAIAKIVKARIEAQKDKEREGREKANANARAKGMGEIANGEARGVKDGGDDGIREDQSVGIAGADLWEAMQQREKQAEEERKREKRLEQEDEEED